MIDEAEARRYIEDRSIPIPEAGCWLWLLSLGSHGYGNAFDGDTVVVAHRLSFMAFVGPIPDGMLVQHSCDSKWCVNPDHLSLGTDATNALDKQLKGRAAKKLTAEQVRAIRRLLSLGAPQKTIADAVGVDQAIVNGINRGRIWRHVA